ncbi:hypothetical protein D1007_02010 [Hordeum vulgare]|nr:hypothetical protein D1007_02010 [Hordeum vulgare]
MMHCPISPRCRLQSLWTRPSTGSSSTPAEGEDRVDRGRRADGCCPDAPRSQPPNIRCGGEGASGSSASALPTPSPEAHVLFRRLASAMAVRPVGICAGT